MPLFGRGKKNIGQGRPLPELPGQEESWEWRGHRIVYSVLGQGAPLLVQHSINAAAWAFEMRQNLEPLATRYRVYAPDLPGFGRSERKPITYTARMYIDFLTDFARYIKEREGQAPAGISSTLAAAYLIAGAAQAPDAFGPLVLVGPTGLQRLDFEPTPRSLGLHKKLLGPLGTGLFWLLTSRWSTRIFLARDGYYNKKVISRELIEGFHRSARQPNAKYAPVCFIAFLLNHNVSSEWPGLPQPVLLAWGRNAKITPLEDANMFLALRPATRLKVFDQARLSLYDEKPDEFNRLALEWLGQHHHTTDQTATGAA